MSINIYMFTTSPKIFAHKSAIETHNFVIPEYILNKGQDEVNLFHRFCPHRMYPLAVPGTHVDEINCEFHDFKWTSTGIPINNDRKLSCGKASVGRSGLIFKNFIEPNHIWVDNLAKETSLEYSHSMQGTSTGSWLWMMEIQADLLHIRSGEGGGLGGGEGGGGEGGGGEGGGLGGGEGGGGLGGGNGGGEGGGGEGGG